MIEAEQVLVPVVLVPVLMPEAPPQIPIAGAVAVAQHDTVFEEPTYDKPHADKDKVSSSSSSSSDDDSKDDKKKKKGFLKKREWLELIETNVLRNYLFSERQKMFNRLTIERHNTQSTVFIQH